MSRHPEPSRLEPSGRVQGSVACRTQEGCWRARRRRPGSATRSPRERRALPWVRMERDYVFDTQEGRRPLADLFDGRHQLVMQHFMLAPGWGGLQELLLHGRPPDATLVHRWPSATPPSLRSRARRSARSSASASAWAGSPWVSSHGTTFNWDFHVSFTADEGGRQGRLQFPAASRQARRCRASAPSGRRCGTVFHTYSTYGRGVEVMMHTYRLLEPSTAKGRDQDARCASPMEWGATTTATSRAPAAKAATTAKACCAGRARALPAKTAATRPRAACARVASSRHGPDVMLMSAFHAVPWLRPIRSPAGFGSKLVGAGVARCAAGALASNRYRVPTA